jgi:hypothetical protein
LTELADRLGYAEYESITEGDMTEGYNTPGPERFGSKPERIAYKRGIAEGQRRTKRLLNCMCATNTHLLELVRVMDEDMPVVSLPVPFGFAERIVAALKKPLPNYALANELQEIIDRKNQEISPAIKEAEEQLLAMVC